MATLRRVLESIGYKLGVRQRMTPTMTETRRAVATAQAEESANA